MENSGLVVVQCPECGLKLSFKPVANYEGKPITCPKCKHSDRVGNFILVKKPEGTARPASTHTVATPPPAPAKPAPSGRIPGATPTTPGQKLAAGTVNTPTANISLICVDTQEKRRLSTGDNTIGRKSSHAKASLTFDDPEQYMSRLHATVSVRNDKNGVMLQLRDEGSMNGTYVKGKRIPANAIVKIKPGDRFQLGALNFICSTD